MKTFKKSIELVNKFIVTLFREIKSEAKGFKAYSKFVFTKVPKTLALTWAFAIFTGIVGLGYEIVWYIFRMYNLLHLSIQPTILQIIPSIAVLLFLVCVSNPLYLLTDHSIHFGYYVASDEYLQSIIEH